MHQCKHGNFTRLSFKMKNKETEMEMEGTLWRGWGWGFPPLLSVESEIHRRE